MITRRLRWGISVLAIAGMGCATGYTQSEVQVSGRYQSRPPADHYQGDELSESYFYDALAPHGQWIEYERYGWCWTPYDVDADWRPYSDGHWEYTDYGWSWASNESWGWATYHYGRWTFDRYYGWVWVPGTEWAPAWVAWRYGDDWCGWAPLPPTVGWDVNIGARFTDASVIPVQHWCFVPQRYLLDVNVRPRIASVARNVTLVQRTRDATRFEVRNGRPVNLGIEVNVVENVVGRRIPRARVVDANVPQRGLGRRTGDAVGYFRPRIRESQGARPRPEVTERVTALPESEWRRQRDEQRRKLEADLAAERARLQRAHQEEERTPPQGRPSEEVRRRHAEEQKAFEEHAQTQREVLQERHKRKIVKPKQVTNENRGKGKPRDKDRDRGEGS